jgi:hypothetical protein
MPRPRQLSQREREREEGRRGIELRKLRRGKMKKA